MGIGLLQVVEGLVPIADREKATNGPNLRDVLPSEGGEKR
jgi:hypothetical protein